MQRAACRAREQQGQSSRAKEQQDYKNKTPARYKATKLQVGSLFTYMHKGFDICLGTEVPRCSAGSSDGGSGTYIHARKCVNYLNSAHHKIQAAQAWLLLPDY